MMDLFNRKYIRPVIVSKSLKLLVRLTLCIVDFSWVLELFKLVDAVKIGVALMVFQQFVGINGVGFYASETFVQAGKSYSLYIIFSVIYFYAFLLKLSFTL